MPISSDRSIGVDTRMLASIPTEAVQPVSPQSAMTPGVQDLLGAFKNGFITVDDIQKRIADRPVEQSNRDLTLQVNDFKSRRLAEQEQLAPADFALKLEDQKLTRLKNEAFEKDLNAAAAIRPDTDALKAHLAKLNERKASLEMRKMSTDDKERRDAHKDEQNFSLETAFSTTFGELPEFVTLPSPAKALPVDRWMPVAKDAFIRDQTQQFLNTNPQADAAQILATQAEQAKYFDQNAGDLYDAYALEQSQKAGVAYQGTPAYYKELNRKITERAQNKLTEGAQFKAYEAGLSEAAKNAAGGGKVTESKIKRLNPSTQLEEDVLIRTDAGGKILSETVLAANAPAFTEQQAGAKMYATRMNFNNNILEGIEQKGFDPTSLGTTLQRFLPNRLRGDDAQQYDAAKRNWISAVLRKESGATITPSEMSNAAAQYFPRDGDSPESVKQKQQLRHLVETEMQSLSGPAAPTAGAPAATGGTDPYAALLGKTVTDRKTGRKGVVIRLPDGTYTIR